MFRFNGKPRVGPAGAFIGSFCASLMVLSLSYQATGLVAETPPPPPSSDAWIDYAVAPPSGHPTAAGASLSDLAPLLN